MKKKEIMEWLSDLNGEKAMAEIDTAYLFPRRPAA